MLTPLPPPLWPHPIPSDNDLNKFESTNHPRILPQKFQLLWPNGLREDF